MSLEFFYIVSLLAQKLPPVDGVHALSMVLPQLNVVLFFFERLAITLSDLLKLQTQYDKTQLRL